MATVSKFTRGAVAGNGWTNPANATADDGVYATTAPGKNATVTGDWDFAAITSADIPDGATINSVTAEVQWKASQGSFNTMGLGVLSGGAIVGSMVSVNPAPLSDTVQQLAWSVVPSLTDLQTAGTISVRVSHKKGNTTNSYTGSLDYVKVTVDYTAASGVTGTGGVTFGTPAFNGSGTNTPPAVSGSGGVTLVAPSLSGSGSAGSVAVSGSCAVAFTAPSFAASGKETFTATGGVSFARLALSGNGALSFSGSGGITVARPSFSGTNIDRTSSGPPAGSASMMGLGI